MAAAGFERVCVYPVPGNDGRVRNIPILYLSDGEGGFNARIARRTLALDVLQMEHIQVERATRAVVDEQQTSGWSTAGGGELLAVHPVHNASQLAFLKAANIVPQQANTTNTILLSLPNAATAADRLGARAEVVNTLMMLYALATPGVDCSAATVRDAMEVSLSRCLNMPPMLPKASLYGDWDGPYGLTKEQKAAEPVKGQLRSVEVFLSCEINLDRARPGTPAAVRTVEKVQAALSRALGYLANVEKIMSGPPSVEWLLNGDALARYIVFLVANRQVKAISVHTNLADLLSGLNAYTARFEGNDKLSAGALLASLARYANAYAARARATSRPSVAELEEAGRYMDLHALAGSYDLAEQQWGEMWQAEGRTRPVAVFLQALVFLGFLFRHHAPNRPGVLAACGVEAGCLDPACRLPDCKGNYVENGQFHVIHDKTEASHGQRPPAPVHPRLQQLLFHWMDWARDLFTTDPGNLSLFVVPSTGAGMSANYASSYVSTALKEVLNSSQEVLICSNMIRRAFASATHDMPERDLAAVALAAGTSANMLRRTYDIDRLSRETALGNRLYSQLLPLGVDADSDSDEPEWQSDVDTSSGPTQTTAPAVLRITGPVSQPTARLELALAPGPAPLLPAITGAMCAPAATGAEQNQVLVENARAASKRRAEEKAARKAAKEAATARRAGAPSRLPRAGTVAFTQDQLQGLDIAALRAFYATRFYPHTVTTYNMDFLRRKLMERFDTDAPYDA